MNIIKTNSGNSNAWKNCNFRIWDFGNCIDPSLPFSSQRVSVTSLLPLVLPKSVHHIPTFPFSINRFPCLAGIGLFVEVYQFLDAYVRIFKSICQSVGRFFGPSITLLKFAVKSFMYTALLPTHT